MNLTEEISVVRKNLARAKTATILEAIGAEYESLVARQSQIKTEVERLTKAAREHRPAPQAIENIDRLAELASDSTNLLQVEELFRSLNVKLFLRFNKVQQGKRTKSVLADGVLTLGAAEGPIQPYAGPTTRAAVANSKKEALDERSFPRREMPMLGNVSHAEA